MTRQAIYDQHNKAFRNVSAYVLMKDGEQVGTIAFKYPKDGAGRLYCYLHIHALPMVRAFAGGYGYDKTSAAFDSATQAQATVKLEEWQSSSDNEPQLRIARELVEITKNMGGLDWNRALMDADYQVLKAV